MRPGETVTHDYLGRGVIIKLIDDGFFAVVKFNKNPSKAYNLGHNPCTILTDNLEVVEEGK